MMSQQDMTVSVPFVSSATSLLPPNSHIVLRNEAKKEEEEMKKLSKEGRRGRHKSSTFICVGMNSSLL